MKMAGGEKQSIFQQFFIREFRRENSFLTFYRIFFVGEEVEENYSQRAIFNLSFCVNVVMEKRHCNNGNVSVEGQSNRNKKFLE